jgi:teichuronic acid biosynthesis glycosyltransferase TuaC
MRVAVVAEFFPRVTDPVWGVWTLRQALAARDAGADVEVVVLHRPVPPNAQLKDREAWRRALAEPRRRQIEGLPVTTVRYLAPARGSHYGAWGAYAAPQLALALARLGRFDLVHAHNAVPAGHAALRALNGLRRHSTPLVVSIHGGDVLWTAHQRPAWNATVHNTYAHARMVLANSTGIAALARRHGAGDVRVVRLGTDLPATFEPAPPVPTIVTVAHLIARKRHADVLRALWLLRDSHPQVQYRIVGDGPERGRLEALTKSLGLADRVHFTGQLPHDEAMAEARRGTLFAMPSVDEAFGVVYVEAMAGGLPAIAAVGEPGPMDIAKAGDGIVLVPPGDPEVLSRELDRLLSDRVRRERLGARARRTVQEHFTWEQCGTATVQAYEDALR